MFKTSEMVLQCNYSPYREPTEFSAKQETNSPPPPFPHFNFNQGLNEREEIPRRNLKRKFDNRDNNLIVTAKSGGKVKMEQNVTKVGEKLRKSSQQKNSLGKRRKIDLTLEWLEGNYMICEGVCLARCILYNHYLDFCEKNNLEPACAATFGKTIRHKFPRVTTRRLGTRGHSKYHYYGIGIRETSIYYNSVYAGKGLTRFSPKSKHEETNLGKASLNKDGTSGFFGEFPDVRNFASDFENGISRAEVQNFVELLKAFCERLLNAALNRDLEAIPSILHHCWTELPCQTNSVLLHDVIVGDIIILCDSLLNEALNEIFLPIPFENIDERFLLEIETFSKHWVDWCRTSMTSLPAVLVGKKLNLAQQFSQSISRQISIINLSRTVRSIFNNPASFQPMLNDVEMINLENIGSQAFYPTQDADDREQNLNSDLLKDLKDLLKKHSPVETLIEWLDTLVDMKVIKPSRQNGRSLKKRAQDFLYKWSFFEARITHNLTINKAVSFNSYHCLRMLMDEYILFAIETQFSNEKKQEIKNTVSKHAKQVRTSHVVSSMPGVSSSEFCAYGSNPSQATSSSFNRVNPARGSCDYETWYPSNVHEKFTEKNDTNSYFPSQLTFNREANQSNLYQEFYPQTSYAGSAGEYFAGYNPQNSIRGSYTNENCPVFTNLQSPPTSRNQNFNFFLQSEPSASNYTSDYYGTLAPPRELQSLTFTPLDDGKTAIEPVDHYDVMNVQTNAQTGLRNYDDSQLTATASTSTSIPEFLPLTSHKIYGSEKLSAEVTYNLAPMQPINCYGGYGGDYQSENKTSLPNYG
ncbi:DNA-binding protein RFX6-like [Clavelina lepadiformis]|uniref:DNA-binding protein RFX6-like n=1 Tax=Clavelina lepadiformis TaxID=159417 RepID=UPI004042F793